MNVFVLVIFPALYRVSRLADRYRVGNITVGVTIQSGVIKMTTTGISCVTVNYSTLPFNVPSGFRRVHRVDELQRPKEPRAPNL